jgi:ribosomal protein L32
VKKLRVFTGDLAKRKILPRRALLFPLCRTHGALDEAKKTPHVYAACSANGNYKTAHKIHAQGAMLNRLQNMHFVKISPKHERFQ